MAFYKLVDLCKCGDSTPSYPTPTPMGRREKCSKWLPVCCLSLCTVDVEPDQYYSYFLDLIKNLMDCSIESSQYEDTLREMYGINSYTAFTMDKQVQQIVRTVSSLLMLCVDLSEL